MPQKTDLNVSPYYDDFDETDNFKRILFRPGFSAQARELTQLQSALQNQIEKHGSHIFKEGAVVIPGQLSFNNKFYTLKLASTFETETIVPSQYYNATTPVTIIGVTTGVTAQVIGYTAATTTSQPLLHIDYINTGTDKETTIFADGENITAGVGITHTTSYATNVASATTYTSTFTATVLGSTPTDTVDNLSSATGPASRVGSAVKIESGVYYIRGHFVTCSEETLVLDPYDTDPSYRVGFTVTETLVSPDTDSTLLDNATGSSNFAAKGAHRLKISLALSKLARSSTADSVFIQLMDVLKGTVQSIVRNTEYSILEEALARKISEESGDYTVRPFQIEVRESVDNTALGHGGIYQTRSLTSGSKTEDGNTPSSSLLAFNISPGKAYIKGHEVEKLVNTIKDVNKARDFQTVNAGITTFDLGNYVFVDNIYGTPDVTYKFNESTAFKKIELYDTATFTSRGTATGNLIGVARSRAMEYSSGTTPGATSSNTSSVYKLYLFDIRPLTKLVLSGTPSPALIASHSNGGVFVTGNNSGATGFVYASGTSGTSVKLTNVTGTFKVGEKIKASDLSTSIVKDDSNPPVDLTILTITTYTFSDVRSVYMQDPTGTGEDFTGDCVLEKKFSPLVTLNNPDIAKLKDTEKNIAMFKLPKKVIKTLLTTTNNGVTDTQYTVRRQFIGTTNSSGAVSFDAGTNESFSSHTEKDYTMSILSAGTAGSGTGVAGDIVSISGSISSTGSSSITITDTSVLGNGAKVKLFATLLKTSVTQKSKTTKLMKQMKVSTGTTGAYGTRPADKTISIGRADVFNLAAIYDSEATDTDAITPSLTLGSIDGTFIRGEKIIGSLSGAKGRIIGTSSPMSYVSTTPKDFTTSDIITGVSSGASAPVSTVIEGSVVVTSRYLLDTGQRDNFYDIARITRKSASSAPTGKLLIVYDYMEHGTGDLLSVDSYTDVALQMRYDDIPQYAATKIDPDATKPTGLFPLQDTYDFRPRVKDIAGTSSTLSTVDEITGNSFDFYSRLFNGTGSSTVDVGKPGSFVQSDFEYYLAKMVSVHLSTTGKFTISEGASSEHPSLPTVPEIGLRVFDVFLPAYTFDKDNVIVTRKRHQRFTMKDIGKLEERLDHVEYYTALNMLERTAESYEITDANGLNRFKSGFVVDNFSGHRVGDTAHVDYKNSIDMENNELRPQHKMKVVRLNENVTTDAERTSVGYQRTGHLLTLPYTEETIVEQPFATGVERISSFHTFSWVGDINLNPASDEWFETEIAPELVVNVGGNYDAVISAVTNQIGTIWNAWETQWAGVSAVSGNFVRDKYGKIVSAINTYNTSTGTTTISSAVVAQIDRESQGSKIISKTIIPYVRQRNVAFSAAGLKPHTKVYVFFGRSAVSNFVTPKTSDFSNITSPVAGSQLITNGAGTVKGTLAIPDPKIVGNIQIPTGEVQFRITSSSVNRLDHDPITAAQTIYTASGILETFQETIFSTATAYIVADSIVATTSSSKTLKPSSGGPGNGDTSGNGDQGLGGGGDPPDSCTNDGTMDSNEAVAGEGTLGAAGDAGGSGNGGGSEGGKVICTALNSMYGFGSFRNAIWMKYNTAPKSSVKYPTSKILELGYQKVFGPLTEKMPDSPILAKILRRIARVRTDRVRREMLGKPLTLESKVHLAIFRLPLLGLGWLVSKNILTEYKIKRKDDT